MTTAEQQSELVYLTPTQRAVLTELCADGAGIATIAKRLSSTENAIKAHLSAIRVALNVSNSTGIIARVLNGHVTITDTPGRWPNTLPPDAPPARSKASTVVHLGPAPGAVLLVTGCCHQLTAELPNRDVVTRMPGRVTCPNRAGSAVRGSS